MNVMSIQCCNVHISLLPDKPFSVEPPKGMYYIGSILSVSCTRSGFEIFQFDLVQASIVQGSGAD